MGDAVPQTPWHLSLLYLPAGVSVQAAPLDAQSNSRWWRYRGTGWPVHNWTTAARNSKEAIVVTGRSFFDPKAAGRSSFVSTPLLGFHQRETRGRQPSADSGTWAAGWPRPTPSSRPSIGWKAKTRSPEGKARGTVWSPANRKPVGHMSTLAGQCYPDGIAGIPFRFRLSIRPASPAGKRRRSSSNPPTDFSEEPFF